MICHKVKMSTRRLSPIRIRITKKNSKFHFTARRYANAVYCRRVSVHLSVTSRYGIKTAWITQPTQGL